MSIHLNVVTSKIHVTSWLGMGGGVGCEESVGGGGGGYGGGV